MKLKPTVNLLGLHPKMQIANSIAATIYFKYSYEFVITAAIEGGHTSKSLHPYGRACDYRIKNIKTWDEVKAMTEELKDQLGADYAVILEKDHIHVEYDPKNTKLF